MNRSEKNSNVLKAILAVQSEAPLFEKTGKNPHFNSRYVELGGILKELKPLWVKHGLTVVQYPGPITVTEKVGLVSLTTTVCHNESGEWVEDVTQIPLARLDPQAYGSALTYQKRYVLTSIFAVCGEDEDDDGNKGTGPQAIAKSPITQLKAAVKDAPKHMNADVPDVISGTITMKKVLKQGNRKDGTPWTLTEFTVATAAGEVAVVSFVDKGEPGFKAAFSGLTKDGKNITAKKIEIEQPMAPADDDYADAVADDEVPF